MDQQSRQWESAKKITAERFEKIHGERVRMQGTLRTLETSMSKHSSEVQRYNRVLNKFIEEKSQLEKERLSYKKEQKKQKTKKDGDATAKKQDDKKQDGDKKEDGEKKEE